MDRERAQADQTARTYRSLRRGMLAIAIGFPLVLLAWTWIRCERLLPGPSISGYYHAHDPFVGDVFVGALCATGVLLVLYRGFSTSENVLLDIAGLCVVGVALFPTVPEQAPCFSPDGSEPARAVTVHGILAVAFFLAIAGVALFVSKTSLRWIDDDARRKRFDRTYNALGVAMIGLPVGAWLLLTLFRMHWAIFALETLAIWVFAGYWYVKGRELRLSEDKSEFARAACRDGW